MRATAVRRASVGVARNVPQVTAIRDSKVLAGPWLLFTATAWAPSWRC
ncbi:DUF397 domain-containing protein [Streptomyces tubercidicus]